MTDSLYTQLAKAQAEFTVPKRTKEVKGAYVFHYAPLDEVLAAVRPALAKNGLFLTQDIVTHEERECIRTRVYCGEAFIENHWPMIITERGAQKHAGGSTFARRYGISALLGLAPEDDDDGNAAEGNAVVISDRRPAANGNGTHKPPQTKPLPPAPEPQAVYDPETGEVTPHLIPVQQSQLGKADWVGWGGKLVAALAAAKTREEGEAWLRACKAALGNCERDAPKVHERVQANIQVMRERLPDFMAAQ